MHAEHQEMEKCIAACSHCHDTCLRMAATHCLDQGGDHVRPPHYVLMLDCAQICHTAADFMLRASPRHGAVCGVCADTCSACADDCAKLDGMEDCVKACRTCAKLCLAMSARRSGSR